MTTPDNTVVEVLEDGSTVVEDVTTVEQEEEYYVQLQGSDRKYPAIVLRRKHRGKGATIRTISKNGQHSDLYADFEESIRNYIDNRQKRIDNTADQREEPTTRDAIEGDPGPTGEGWIDQAIQSVVKRRDNGPADTD